MTDREAARDAVHEALPAPRPSMRIKVALQRRRRSMPGCPETARGAVWRPRQSIGCDACHGERPLGVHAGGCAGQQGRDRMPPSGLRLADGELDRAYRLAGLMMGERARKPRTRPRRRAAGLAVAGVAPATRPVSRRGSTGSSSMSAGTASSAVERRDPACDRRGRVGRERVDDPFPRCPRPRRARSCGRWPRSTMTTGSSSSSTTGPT